MPSAVRSPRAGELYGVGVAIACVPPLPSNSPPPTLNSLRVA